jgi:hypothetical protein
MALPFWGLEETVSKQEQRFAEAVQVFNRSEKTPADLLELIRVVSTCLRQGDGLAWSQVVQIVLSPPEQ